MYGQEKPFTLTYGKLIFQNKHQKTLNLLYQILSGQRNSKSQGHLSPRDTFWAKSTFSLQKNNEMKYDIHFISVLL